MARQKSALERWTNPKLSRRTCSPGCGLQLCRRDFGRAWRNGGVSSSPESVRFALKSPWVSWAGIQVTGAKWQFKDWPFKGAADGDLVDTFAHVKGKISLGDAKRARWVTLRARRRTLRARWVKLRELTG